MEKREYIVSGFQPCSYRANLLIKAADMGDGLYIAFADKLIISYRDQATEAEKAIQYIKESYEKAGGLQISVVPVDLDESKEKN